MLLTSGCFSALGDRSDNLNKSSARVIESHVKNADSAHNNLDAVAGSALQRQESNMHVYVRPSGAALHEKRAVIHRTLETEPPKDKDTPDNSGGAVDRQKKENDAENAAMKDLGDGDDASKQKKEEDALVKEEQNSLGGGLGALTTALTDPRAFLISLPGMSQFVAGLKVAVSLQPGDLKGKCLQEGEFMGAGCANDGKAPQICSCKGLLEHCWVEDDEQKIVKTYTGGDVKGALEMAKSLLFGKCYTPTWLVCLIVFGVLLVLGIGAFVAKKMFGKKEESSDDD